MSYMATAIPVAAPIVVSGYKYWRINSVSVNSGGYLEISELQFYSDSTKISGTMTASSNPQFGAVSDINDGDLNTRNYWTEGVATDPNFWIQMEFATAQDINGIKIGSYDNTSRYLGAFTLQKSLDGISWITVGSASGLTFSVSNSLSSMISFD